MPGTSTSGCLTAAGRPYGKCISLSPRSFSGYDRGKYRRRDSGSLVVNHIDGDKTNNSLDNLEIITQRENVQKYWRSKRT